MQASLMHIAFYTNTYFPVVSGVVQSINTFRNTLTAQGHNVFIFAQEAEGYQDTEPCVFRYPAFSLTLQPKNPRTRLTIPMIIPSKKLINPTQPK